MQGNMFLPPPYNYIEVIDFAGNVAWSVPSTVLICEVRVVAPECDTAFQIYVDTEHNSRVRLRGIGENIWRIIPTRIWRTGTLPNSIRSRIEVYGYLKRTIETY